MWDARALARVSPPEERPHYSKAPDAARNNISPRLLQLATSVRPSFDATERALSSSAGAQHAMPSAALRRRRNSLVPTLLFALR